MPLSIGSFSLTRIHAMPSSTLLSEERGFDLGTPQETHRRHPSTAAPGGHSWGRQPCNRESTPPGLRCPLRRVGGRDGGLQQDRAVHPSSCPKYSVPGSSSDSSSGLSSGSSFGSSSGSSL